MRIRGVPLPDNVLSPAPAAWPAPAGAPVLLFGGTFDPPHPAHVELPLKARDALFGDAGWLVYVPAARNPHKARGPAASDTDRLEMLRLATAGVDRCGVWTDEIDRARPGEPSFWVDTLARAASLVGDDTPLRFLIGADQALAFTGWRAHGTILALAEPAVMLREPIVNREVFRRQLQMTGMDIGAWLPRVASTAIMPVASTGVRAMLADGADARGVLDEAVAAYVEERGLYR